MWKKREELLMCGINFQISILCSTVILHRDNHRLHRKLALTFFNLPFTFDPVDG